MNRRNFVVGLGTVATISGVASVTSAAFQDSVNPTTNFQIVPEDANLAVRRLQENVDYNNLDANASWNESKITDFGNVTGDVGNRVVAYANQSEGDQLLMQLAFNNSNASDVVTYNEYEFTPSDNNGQFGFFEVANLGQTTENVGIEFNYDTNNVDPANEGGSTLDATEVENMFQFFDEDGTRISPDPTVDAATPDNFSRDIDSGKVETIGLRITINNSVYNTIQEAAGGAFSETDDSIQLLESINVGTQV